MNKAIYALYPHPIPDKLTDEIRANSTLLNFFYELSLARKQLKLALDEDEHCALAVYYHGLRRIPLLCYMKLQFYDDNDLFMTQVIFLKKNGGWDFVWYDKDNHFHRWLKDLESDKTEMLDGLTREVSHLNCEYLIPPQLAQKSTDIMITMGQLNCEYERSGDRYYGGFKSALHALF